MFSGSSPITVTSSTSKACQKSGPFPPLALPSINSNTALSDSRPSHRSKAGVEAVTLAQDGSPPITRITFPTCRAQYPGGPNRCPRRLLPHLRGLPRISGGSASTSSLSRPAQALLTLRPAGLLNPLLCHSTCSRARNLGQRRPRRPLSRGFDEASCPAAPLVSFRFNRQLSGWNLPP